jgi:hypothetical protein
MLHMVWIENYNTTMKVAWQNHNYIRLQSMPWKSIKIATMSSMMGAVKHYLEYEYKRGVHSVMEEDND